MDESVTRREYAVMVGSLGAAALAGCSGSADDNQSTRDGNSSMAGDDQSTSETADDSTTDAEIAFPTLTVDEPTFRNWIPGTGDLRGVFDAAHNLALAREHRDRLPPATYESIAGWAMFGGYVGMEYEEMDAFLASLGLGAVVYVGSVAPSTVASRLEPTRFDRFDQQDAVTYYQRPDPEQPTFLGVGAEGVVYGSGGHGAATGQNFVETASTLFETVRGERPRLHEESDLYERYTDSLGWPLVAGVRPPAPTDPGSPAGGTQTVPAADTLPAGMVSDLRSGYGEYLADGSTVDRYWLYLPESADTTPSELRDTYRTDEIRSQFDGQLAVRLDGQIVDVAVVTPVEESGGGARPPVVSVDIAVDSGTATIAHVAGDPLPLDPVTLYADGDRITLGSGTLSPGESLDVEVGTVDQVRLIYEAPSGSSTTVIGES